MTIEPNVIFHPSCIIDDFQEAFDHQSLGDTICCNVASQWAEGCLRAYLLDTREKSVHSIIEQTTVEDLYSAILAEQNHEEAV